MPSPGGLKQERGSRPERRTHDNVLRKMRSDMSASTKSLRRAIRQIRYAGRARADRMFGTSRQSSFRRFLSWLQRLLRLR